MTEAGAEPKTTQASEQEPPLRWLLREVLPLFLLTRGILVLVGWMAQTRLPLPRYGGHTGAAPTGNLWLDTWTHWDAGWYWEILRHGYHYVPGQASDVNFLPLYPALIRLAAWPFGESSVAWVVAALVISALSALATIGFLIALVALDYDRATARRTAFYLFIFPTSLYLSAMYADGLFLALTVAAFFFARRGQWAAAGALGALAALARPYGVFLVLPLAYEYFAQREFQWRTIRVDILDLGLIPLAYGGWAFYLYKLSGNPKLVFTAGAAWGRGLTPPWRTFHMYMHGGISPDLHTGAGRSIIDLGFSLLFLVLVPLTWRRLRPSYALTATVLYLVMISSGNLQSLMRYQLTLFPVFLMLALAGRREWFDRLYVTLALALSGVFMTLWALGYWLA